MIRSAETGRMIPVCDQVDEGCGRCYYFDRLNDGSEKRSRIGKCHRYPPIVVVREVKGTPTIETTAPRVSDTYWCGEYEPGHVADADRGIEDDER